MTKIKDENIRLEAGKRMREFQERAPSEITDLVINYVDTFDFVKTAFESAGLSVEEDTVLQIARDIMQECIKER